MEAEFGAGLGGPSCSNLHVVLHRRSGQAPELIKRLSATRAMTCPPITKTCTSRFHLRRWSKRVRGRLSTKLEVDAHTTWARHSVGRVAPLMVSTWTQGHAKGAQRTTTKLAMGTK